MGRLIAGEDTRTAAVVAGEHGFEVRR
jgi:hypothetical protein